jgi:yjeF C-terminal region, hydroxyethylthiazole kinase-related
MSGAGSMSSRAALRSGAGVVLWAVAKSLNNVAESMSPEVMTLPLPETSMGAPAMEAREILVEAARECDCVLLGPGLPVAGETGELMRLLIPEIFPTLVLDGGALTAIGDDMMILRKRQSPTIITPHPGEMGRLTKKTASDVQAKRNDFAVKYAKLSGAVVALKGANTLVTNGIDVYENKTGNPGMATAGSGDVLGGVIAAMVGLGLEPFAAAKLGVFLHGYAGDLVRSEKGMRGLIASDMIDKLPKALLDYEAAKR